MLGTVGNKGSCFFRFSYLDTRIAIACAHLAAGGKNHKQRIEELIDIINKPLTDQNTKQVSYIINIGTKVKRSRYLLYIWRLKL